MLPYYWNMDSHSGLRVAGKERDTLQLHVSEMFTYLTNQIAHFAKPINVLFKTSFRVDLYIIYQTFYKILEVFNHKNSSFIFIFFFSTDYQKKAQIHVNIYFS